MKTKYFFIIYVCALAYSCHGQLQDQIITGAEQLDQYLPLLDGKKVGVVGNQSSLVGNEHLVDVLLAKGVNLQFVAAPEHGFRGTVRGGEASDIERDERTGLPIYSIYSPTLTGYDHKTDSVISTVDVVLFDLQDVGARFYTYSTALHQAMQLCAKNNTTLIILDRPNPNGDQVDGPVRKSDEFKAVVCFHKIAMVHGLTLGELAKMINGEGWLDDGMQCDLQVVKVKNYTHKTQYDLPVKPSPNLPNHISVRLYPSLCLFEASPASVGRGTDYPFQAVGYPDPSFGDSLFSITPRSRDNTPVEGRTYFGLNLSEIDPLTATFTLKYILYFHKKAQEAGIDFFRPQGFNIRAGNADLLEQINAGWTEEQIREGWKEELADYKQMRKKYLLYEDFE